MEHSRSDIDVAVITRNANRRENFELLKGFSGQAPPIYDIKIFELLPLKMKIQVADNFKSIFGNRIELTEYFYFYRKLWNDCKHRIEENQFKNSREKTRLMKEAREVLG
jgi:hypothetical protein